MKKTTLKLLTLVFALALCLTVLVACNDSKTAYPIPDDLSVSVGIYVGNDDAANLKGTITKDTLASMTQQKVSMTTTNSYETTSTSVYVAYNVASAITKLGLNIPAITSVHAFASDNHSKLFEITSLSDSFITIGFEENDKFAADSKGPRFIGDKNSSSANDIEKSISKLVINPVDSTNPVLSVNMTQGDKTNPVTVPNSAYATAVTPVSHDSTKNGVTTTYYGFNLGDIIDSMGKTTKSGSWLGFFDSIKGTDYKVEFETAENDGATEKCVFTAAEIAATQGETPTNYIKVVYDAANGNARVYSDYADTDPKTFRNQFKGAVKMTVYNADGSVNATLAMSWGY